MRHGTAETEKQEEENVGDAPNCGGRNPRGAFSGVEIESLFRVEKDFGLSQVRNEKI